MTYRKTRKSWSVNANAKKERERLQSSETHQAIEEDEITIEITRKLTKEHVVFKLLPGDRTDNYRVYVEGKLTGIMGITKVCEGIRKALPRVLSRFSLSET
jgi:hypothetical protein